MNRPYLRHALTCAMGALAHYAAGRPEAAEEDIADMIRAGGHAISLDVIAVQAAIDTKGMACRSAGPRIPEARMKPNCTRFRTRGRRRRQRLALRKAFEREVEKFAAEWVAVVAKLSAPPLSPSKATFPARAAGGYDATQ